MPAQYADVVHREITDFEIISNESIRSNNYLFAVNKSAFIILNIAIEFTSTSRYPRRGHPTAASYKRQTAISRCNHISLKCLQPVR